MIETPQSGRLHIVLAGARNSGKSSLLNALAGQQVSIVSDVPGTTTDHVSKAMEIMGLGPCLLIDTAGLDDSGELGGKRVGSTLDTLRAADLVLALVDAATGHLPDLPDLDVPIVPVLAKCELLNETEAEALSASIAKKYGKAPVRVSAVTGKGIRELIEAIKEAIPADWDALPLTAGVVQEGDLVVLVMPQDKQAPKGRLILPQQQTIRELLDRKCRVVCCTTDCLPATLASLKEAPKAIITDSQDFRAVHDQCPSGTRLTSFSILLAASKGDMDYFRKARARSMPSPPSPRCSSPRLAPICRLRGHRPGSASRMLRARAGEGLRIDVVSGRDFPEDLSGYDLVIHCGSCMFNRRYVLARIQQAKRQGVPMTNYGVAIAHINNLL